MVTRSSKLNQVRRAIGAFLARRVETAPVRAPRLLFRSLTCLLLAGVATRSAASDAPATWGDWPKWGAQGDGTYRNPVLPSDYSDLDYIRISVQSDLRFTVAARIRLPSMA
jgi:hypothetical protein